MCVLAPASANWIGSTPRCERASNNGAQARGMWFVAS